MNTATNYDPSPDRSTAAELPPVLVRVPWLGTRQAPSSVELTRATQRPPVNRALFEPHQLVAAADMDVTDFGTYRTQLRFDPPQETPISAEVHHRRAAASSPTIPSPPATLPPALPVRAVTTPASDGITHLRFDPPVNNVAEPPVQLQAAPVTETSIWHQAVSVLDSVLRRYQRVIMLVALIAAASLMVMVLDNRRPSTEPSPDGGMPTAMDASDLAATPLSEAMQDREPAAIPERVANAQGPRSRQRHSAATMTDETMAPLMLDPIPPHREPSPSITPIESPEPPVKEATYPTTGVPAFELKFPTTTASESSAPTRARLSQEIQLAPQQIKQ